MHSPNADGASSRQLGKAARTSRKPVNRLTPTDGLSGNNDRYWLTGTNCGMKVNGGGSGSLGGGPSAGASSGMSLLSATSFESSMSFESRSDVVWLLEEKFRLDARRLP